MAFLKSFKRDKINCARCQKPLGFSKNIPNPTWGFEGKICDKCQDYIRKGMAVYNVEYIEGHSKIPNRIKGLLGIQLFDHRNRILFESDNKDFNLEITSENFLGDSVVVMNEKSTARQILTAGFSDMKSREYLKIEFKDSETQKIESPILDVNYSLETVQKNLEPILLASAHMRNSVPLQEESIPAITSCKKCGTKNNLENQFCSMCSERLQLEPHQIISLSPVREQRDYILLKGEKSKEELNAEEIAQRLVKPDVVFDVKYLGGHKMYPTKKSRDARIGIFIDRIEILTDKFKLAIPYPRMTNIENMDERRITTKRWFLTGIWAIAWKKNFVYTVIEYTDEHDTMGLIFDFGKHLEDKQGVIYQRMIDARSKKSDKFGGLYQ